MNTNKSTVAPTAFVGLSCSLEDAQRMNAPKDKNRHISREKLKDEFIGPMWFLPENK